MGTANAAHSAAGPNAPLSNGLVGYWPLDGSVTNWATGQTQDLSGNGNVGSLVSMSTTSAPVAGKMGQALNFDLGGYITAVDQSSPNPSDITVSAWIKLSADGSAFRYLLDKTSGGGGYLFKYTLAGATLITGGSGRSSGISYPLNTWHHIVGSYQSGSNQIRLYSDGVLADVGTGGAMTTNSGSLTIGNGPGGTFKGVVDDIRIYNRVLSGSEVAQLYNMGR